MRPIQGAVEQRDNVVLNAIGIHLDAPQKLVPFVERSCTGPREIEVGNFGRRIRASLVT